MLKKGVLKHGEKWLRVASRLPKRTGNDCKARWNELQALAVEENEEVNLVVPQPEWWDELPLHWCHS
jgi:hypothetical protein